MALGKYMNTNIDIFNETAIRVRSVIAETLRIPLEDIELDARLDDTRLGIDSLGFIKLNVALEEAFDITLPDLTLPEAPTLRSVRELVELVIQKAPSRAKGDEQ